MDVTDGDLAGQENEGYLDGQIHCKQGWCTDNSSDDSGINTPYLKGYRRGWDEAYKAGLHGTEPKKRDGRLPYIDDDIIKGNFNQG